MTSTMAWTLFWLAYLSVGVALWRWCAWLRDCAPEAGYVGGMIICAITWPGMLVIFGGMWVVVSVIDLLGDLSRWFRRKR
jgi:hypothetical protein